MEKEYKLFLNDQKLLTFKMIKGAFLIEKKDLQVGFLEAWFQGCLIYGFLFEKSQTISNFEALW